MSVLSSEIREFVNNQRLGYIATVCPDGTPNLSPKGTTIAWDDEHLAFADIHSPGTITNLLKNSSVEVNVVDIFTRKGFRFKGTAEVFSDGPVFEKIVSHYRSIGSKHHIQHIVLVKVERALPIISPAYDMGLTEGEVKERWVAYWNNIHSK